MKIIKYFGFLILFIIVLIFVLLFSLNSSTVLNLIAKEGIEKSGIDFSYKSIEGGVFSGLKIKDANYQDKAKVDLEIDIDFGSLTSGNVDIKTLKATNVWIDKGFLQSLIDTNSSNTADDQSKSDIPIKSINIEHLQLGVLDIAYQSYLLKSANLKVDDFHYDMKKNISGNIAFNAKSNIANVDLNMKIIKSHYVGSVLLKLNESYLNTLVSDQNITLDKVSKIKLLIDGDMDSSDFSLDMGKSTLLYQEYEIQPVYTKLSGNYNITNKDLKSNLNSSIKSNVADINLTLKDDLNIDDINETLHYQLDAKVLGIKSEFSSLLKDINISFKKPSQIFLNAKGSMKSVDANITLHDGYITYEKYTIEPKYLNLINHFDIKNLIFNTKGDGLIDSNVAKFDLNYKSNGALKDINNTLKLDLHAKIDPKEKPLKKLLAEQNITVKKVSSLYLDASTKKRVLHASLHTDESEVGYDDLTIDAKGIKVLSEYNFNTTLFNTMIFTDIKSNIADLHVDANASGNLSDINKTLQYVANSTIKAKEGYLKKRLKEKRIKFKKLSPLKLHIIGDIKELKADVLLDGEAQIKKEYIYPSIKNTTLVYNLQNHKLDGDLDMSLKSSIANISIKANTSFDNDDINDTLKYNLFAKIAQKKSFEGIDLRQLGLLKFKAQGSLKKLDAKLTSSKLNAFVKSEDFDKFVFDINSQKLYIDKLYKKVPSSLKKSFIALWSKGYYSLSEQKGEIKAKVKKLRLSNRYIDTNQFTLSLDGKDFRLTPLEVRAKGFKLSFDAVSKNGEIKAHLDNKAIKGNIDFKPSPLYTKGFVDIPSIEKLLAQINKIYPLKGVPSIKGGLKLRADMLSKSRAKISLSSNYIKLKEGEFKDIAIDAIYQKGRIDIPKFGFWLKDFEPKEMNREVKLEHKAYIVFDENNNTKIDFVLKDFLSFKGEKKGDVTTGKLSTKKLFLGLKGYGETKLTTDIDMFQSSKQLAVSGDIIFEETEVKYESRYLDVSKDPDIIIIDEKHKKKRLEDDSFRKNTFLDLHIKSKDAIVYKVEAGTVEMKPDIEVRKEFGTNVKILGKINILGGEYDVGDKRFTIKEGAVAFRGQEDINPLLDIHVEYPIDEVLILIDVRGDKRKPKLLFKSKPMMSKKDIFSYLLFGFAVSESDGAQSSAANAAEKIFGRALAKDLARELNLDRLDLTRSQLGGINVKAGKKVNKKTIIYYQNKEQTSSIIVERKLGRHFELDTQIGQEGQAIDLFYKKGFK